MHFFYGWLIDERPATLEYGYEAGIGAKILPRWPVAAGIHFGGEGPAGGIRLSAGTVDVLVEASVPNLPAIEYTVLLDYGTNPPDWYIRSIKPAERKAAVIVVQNQYPTDPPLAIGRRVVVRVVGSSGRVMADTFPPNVSAQLAAGPMPIPVGEPLMPLTSSPPAPLKPCMESCNQASVQIPPF